jgi:hypothetical protein
VDPRYARILFGTRAVTMKNGKCLDCKQFDMMTTKCKISGMIKYDYDRLRECDDFVNKKKRRVSK